MTLKERFNELKIAAQKDARAVRNRRTVHGGDYEKGVVGIDGVGLAAHVKTAGELGYETHIRIVDGKLNIYYVERMPSIPLEVLCA